MGKISNKNLPNRKSWHILHKPLHTFHWPHPKDSTLSEFWSFPHWLPFLNQRSRLEHHFRHELFRRSPLAPDQSWWNSEPIWVNEQIAASSLTCPPTLLLLSDERVESRASGGFFGWDQPKNRTRGHLLFLLFWILSLLFFDENEITHSDDAVTSNIGFLSSFVLSSS